MMTAQLAPRPQPVAASPKALPSSFAAGIAASKAITAGGRKMMQTSKSGAPNCCSTYTVVQGDTLDSIAAKFGQSPKNGAAIIKVKLPSDCMHDREGLADRRCHSKAPWHARYKPLLTLREGAEFPLRMCCCSHCGPCPGLCDFPAPQYGSKAA